MGKGQIKSGGEGGLYIIDLLFSTDNYEAEITALDAKIADLQAKYNDFPVDLTPSQVMDKKVTLMSLTSMEKRKSSLENSFESTKPVSAWCADFSEELTGEVGTIEVPGENVSINIKPGYTDDAVHNGGEDGQLQKTVTMDYAGVFYNLAMLPGWQKWKPTYRYGTISDISEDTCSVTLEAATSTQQGLNVNQEDTITNVPIEYMNCNGSAFEDGDEVLVMFENQEWESPKVIGFKSEPRACDGPFLVITTDFWSEDVYHQYCTVWDLKNEKVVDFVEDSEGNPIVFPTWKGTDVTDWLATLRTVPMVAIIPDVETMLAATEIPYECDDLSSGDGHVHKYCEGIIHGVYYDVEGTSTNLIATTEWEEYWTLDENDYHDELISRWQEQYIPIRAPLYYGVRHHGMGWYFEFLDRNRGMYFDRELSSTGAGGTIGNITTWNTSLTYNFHSPFQDQAVEIEPIIHSTSDESQVVENAIYDTDVMISACGTLDLSGGYESYYACISTIRITGGPMEDEEWLVHTNDLIELERNTSGYIYKLKEGETINTIDPFNVPIHKDFSTAVDDLFALTLENKTDYVRHKWADITNDLIISVYKN